MALQSILILQNFKPDFTLVKVLSTDTDTLQSILIFQNFKLDFTLVKLLSTDTDTLQFFDFTKFQTRLFLTYSFIHRWHCNQF